jgi:hypothetical protein
MVIMVWQELRREVGKMGFLYDAEVLTWSSADFSFSYNVRPWTPGCFFPRYICFYSIAMCI